MKAKQVPMSHLFKGYHFFTHGIFPLVLGNGSFRFKGIDMKDMELTNIVEEGFNDLYGKKKLKLDG